VEPLTNINRHTPRSQPFTHTHHSSSAVPLVAPPTPSPPRRRHHCTRCRPRHQVLQWPEGKLHPCIDLLCPYGVGTRVSCLDLETSSINRETGSPLYGLRSYRFAFIILNLFSFLMMVVMRGPPYSPKASCEHNSLEPVVTAFDLSTTD
jgi:hypothetical protein